MKLPPEDYELKYRISRSVPTRFRNAVLDRFEVRWVQEGGYEVLSVHLSYYHLKQNTTLNYRLRFRRDELSGVLGAGPLLTRATQMMVRELKKAGAV